MEHEEKKEKYMKPFCYGLIWLYPPPPPSRLLYNPEYATWYTERRNTKRKCNENSAAGSSERGSREGKVEPNMTKTKKWQYVHVYYNQSHSPRSVR
jgi:hypothetical protein